MQIKSFNLDFSERLRLLMIQKGYASHSASSGVSPAALCKAINCFSETALRYLDGRSIPNPENVLKLAKWLEVDPGFLLFGEQSSQKPKDNDSLKVHKELLAYALQKAHPMLNTDMDRIEFFISILSDLSQMNIEIEQLKKVFDLTIKSSTFFEKKGVAGTKDHGSSRSISRATS